jgi:aspartate carbamoyltransferase catalytic subunit
LKYGRTVHSLIAALSRYTNIHLVLISPDELRIPDYVKSEIIEKKGLSYCETASLEEAMPQLDILYMTRIQRERFDDPDAYERLKDTYILTPNKLKPAKGDMCILHPLPRVNEISVAVDNDPRACYFDQVLNGKYMRMALILKLLETAPGEDADAPDEGELQINTIRCSNPKCITSTEQELDHIFKLTDAEKKEYRCLYCESCATGE